jgi:hypothetical protein
VKVKPTAKKQRGDRSDPARAVIRRKALRACLDAAEMTETDAARAAGMPTPNALYNFLKGRTASLSQSTLEALSRVVPGATLASLTGAETPDNVAPTVRPIQVRAAATAGLMQAAFDMPQAQQYKIVAPITDAMHAQGAFGVEIREPGAEKLYPKGSQLICIPLTSFDGEITNGKHLILQRIVKGRVEVTVREITIEATEAWLWLRSTHPNYQAPVQMAFTPGRPPSAWMVGDDRYIVAAVVVLAIVPAP